MKHKILLSLLVIAGVVWAFISMRSADSGVTQNRATREAKLMATGSTTPKPSNVPVSKTEVSASYVSSSGSDEPGAPMNFLVPQPTLPGAMNSQVAESGTGGGGSEGYRNAMARPTGATPGSYAVDVGASAGGGFSGGLAREISIPVPEGAKVPAVFFDAVEKPLAQQIALDRIAKEFEQNVSEIPQGLTKEEVWEAARAIADERYMTLFGYQAFNQYHIQAAKEALKEKRARANSAGP